MDIAEARVELLELVGTMVHAMIEFPNESRIRHDVRDDVLVFNVKVGPSDLGKLIGKQGKTARSLRTILGAASMKHQLRCELNILTDEPTRAETVRG